MEATRILIIGQKDAMIFSLYQLAELRRHQAMEVVVLTPDENPTVPPSADVAAICESLGYEHRVARSNSILLEAVQSLRPQLLASILWPRRVPTEVLDLCPEAINFHPSLLPKHRGSLTQFWAIFEADATAGTTCHRMVLEFDAGKILHKEEVELTSDETALSLSHKIAITTEKCFRHILDLFLQELQLPEGEAWDVTKFPYRFRKLHADGFIDPTWSLDQVDRFIRAFYFPPYSAARLRLEDGSIHSVLNLEHFQALCSGRPFFASPPFWQRKPTGEQLGQMKRYVQAMALLKRHEDGHPLRQLWEQKLQEATKFWSEKPLGTDVAAEACCAAGASGGDASSDLETLTARLARAVARFSVSPAFEPLLQPLVQRCVEQIPGPGEDPWEEAKRGLTAALSQKNAFANPESSPRPTVGVADAESGVNGVRKTPRIAGGWRLSLASAVALLLLGFRAALGGWLQGGRAFGSFGADVSRASRVALEGSRCMDGSVANMYVAKGYAEGSRKWVIYFQGGGWCAPQHLAHLEGYSPREDVGHPDPCEERAQGYHGSSRDDKEFRDFSQKGILSGDQSVNPLAHNWNRVMVRNCDGTLFLSDAELPVRGGRPLQLRGRRNAMLAIHQLLSSGLADASELLLGGCSAGAVAAPLLGDHVAQTVRRAAAQRGGNVFVAILSDSGFFVDWSSLSRAPPGVLSFPQLQWLFEVGNVSEALPQECLKAGESWRCMLLSSAVPYVKTPSFFLQSTVDSWQLRSLEPSSLEALQDQLRPALLRSLNAGRGRGHGGAVDHCVHHCEAWGEITWGSISNRDAFEGWYRKRLQQWHSSGFNASVFDTAGVEAEEENQRLTVVFGSFFATLLLILLLFVMLWMRNSHIRERSRLMSTIVQLNEERTKMMQKFMGATSAKSELDKPLL